MTGSISPSNFTKQDKTPPTPEQAAKIITNFFRAITKANSSEVKPAHHFPTKQWQAVLPRKP